MTTIAEQPEPQWLLQSPLPRLRLDFYPTAVLMSRWADDGRLTTYPVSIQDVVSACTNVTLGSGLLPAKTLFWKQQANQAMLGIYVPARRWPVQVEMSTGPKPAEYHLPLPPFIFVGHGTAYQIFAVKKRPDSVRAPLFHAPCPNVHANGSICSGNTSFPVCTPQNIQKALQMFLTGSYFNGDLSKGKCRSYPEDVRRLWAELDGRKRFPLKELAPAQMTLGKLVS